MPSQPLATDLREVPAAALLFLADVDLGSAGEALAPRPVSILARSGHAVQHWYWGRVVHDFYGMEVGERIPLDYCHDPAEVVGFGDRFDVSSGELRVYGQLVPFGSDDRASEIAYRADKGTPYQASIAFSETGLVVENVPDDVTVQVNGQSFVGPGTVFRRWRLSCVALCPAGIDPHTSTQFSRAGQTVRIHSFQEAAMPTESTTPHAGQHQATQTDNPPVPGSPAASPPVEAPAAPEPPAAPAPEQAAEQPPVNELAATGKLYLDAFGPDGAIAFAEGLSFEEAALRFAVVQRQRAEDSSKENSQLRAQLAALRGEQNPLSASSEASPAESAANEFASRGVGSNLAVLAASITLPGKGKK